MNALTSKNRSRVRRGFTLIELLLVMVIIAILATILVPRVVNRVGQAKNTKAQADLATLKQAITAFDIDNGAYPTKLDDLITNPGNLPHWEKTLDKNSLPLDPWGRPYIYRCPGSNGTDFDLLSGGPDGQEGSAGAVVAD
ncbi:MAG: type II secretion system major pseudopilin GspG [Tepidisphaeraceae bacterium]|jgi:general secretion pathway protein G